MTQFRNSLSSGVFAGALLAAVGAVSAAVSPAHAYYNRIAFGYAATNDGKSAAADLPAPPTVAAPQPKTSGQDFQIWQKNLGAAGQGQTTTIGGARTISVGGAQAPKPGAAPKMRKAR